MPRLPDLKYLPSIAVFIFGALLLFYSFLSAGFGNWNEKNLYRYTTGFLLLFCILPYIIRISPIDFSFISSVNKKFLRPFHVHLGMIAFALAILHGLFEGRCNEFIESGMLIFSFLLVTGLALFIKSLPIENKRRTYLLHSHHFLVLLLLALLVLGHLLEEIG